MKSLSKLLEGFGRLDLVAGFIWLLVKGRPRRLTTEVISDQVIFFGYFLPGRGIQQYWGSRSQPWGYAFDESVAACAEEPCDRVLSEFILIQRPQICRNQPRVTIALTISPSSSVRLCSNGRRRNRRCTANHIMMRPLSRRALRGPNSPLGERCRIR